MKYKLTTLFILMFTLLSCGFNNNNLSNSESSSIEESDISSEEDESQSSEEDESQSSEEEDNNSESIPNEDEEEVDIDINKNEFIFDESIKYDELYEELNKKNFTLHIELGDREIYEDETIYKVNAYETIAVSEGLFYHKIDYAKNDEYLLDTLEIAKIINNKVHIALINLNNENIEYYKIPLEAFYDTFINKYIATPFAYLKEGENGEFLTSSLQFYNKEYSDYHVSDNTFTLETYNLYFYSEFTHSEVVYYTFSNIGNTKINIEESIFNESNYENYSLREEFTYQGVDYFYSYENIIEANIAIDYFDLVIVPIGSHTIYPEVFDIPVKTIYFPYYVYNKDFSGYEYNVYFSNDLIYQDEYSYIGEINTKIGTSRYDAIEFFVSNNGKFNYYGEW